MTKAPKGRPKKTNNSLSPTIILNTAFALLESKGPSGLTMRALARNLNITPMSIYHHIGDHEALLKAMSAEAYGDLPAPPVSPTSDTLKHLLASYCHKILAHPNLTLCLFVSPHLNEDTTVALTHQVDIHLRSIGLTDPAALDWRDILIDYTHGFALAIAHGTPSPEGAKSTPGLKNYNAAIDRLLSALKKNINEEKPSC